jgi:hypothetical protein
MEKQVKVQLTVSYDKLRQVMCLISGKVLTDQDINELVGNEVLSLETNVFGESKEEIESVISAMILTQKLTQSEELKTPKRSKFEERLEAYKKPNI